MMTRCACLQGLKLQDRRTVESLALQPGQFLVAVQTQKRAAVAAEAPPATQPPGSAPLSQPAPQPNGSAPAAEQPEAAASSAAKPLGRGSARADLQMSPQTGVSGRQYCGLHADSSVRSASRSQMAITGTGSEEDFLSRQEQPERIGAFPATLLPGYTSRPADLPPAIPPRQVQTAQI